MCRYWSGRNSAWCGPEFKDWGRALVTEFLLAESESALMDLPAWQLEEYEGDL